MRRNRWIVLVAVVSALAAAPAAQAQKRVALVVGIDTYDNLDRRAQLKKARSDATAITRVLRDPQLGFDVIIGDDVTRSNFNNRWQDFLNKLAPGDTAAFYFAGHGVEFGGRTYLLPRDVPNIKPGRDELLRREALSLQEFLADLNEKKTRLNLVIVDACRDNPFEQSAGRSVGLRRGLNLTEPPEGTFIMYSAGAGESALDRLGDADRDPNSVYTRHLLPLLRTAGLSLTDVADEVRVAVRDMAATVQHRQTPSYYNQVVGRVCLAGGECRPRVAGSPAGPPATEAAGAWALVKDSTDLRTLDAFQKQYGAGNPLYDRLAEARIEQIKQGESARKKAEEVAQAKERERLALLQRQKEEERKRAEEKRKVEEAAQAAAAAKTKVDEDARVTAEAERICTEVKGISDLALLNVRAGQWMGTPAADCIAARIGELKERAARAEEKRKAEDAARPDPALSVKPGSGKSFRDCDVCPEMVVVPAGSFTMGSPANEVGRDPNEGPQHQVKIGRPFAVGKFEVTFNEWDACLAEGGCTHRPEDTWGRGKQPVMRVSWNDITQQYLPWLSRRTGKTYRLLTEAEWEYVARAGTATSFWWGSSISTSQANYDGNDTYGGSSKGEYRQETVPVDSFPASPWGLFNVHGNVSEWVQDCWNDSYKGAPSYGSAWTTGNCSGRACAAVPGTTVRSSSAPRSATFTIPTTGSTCTGSVLGGRSLDLESLSLCFFRVWGEVSTYS